ncbi:type II 3-dehydroquinate dehydratase [Desulfovibrio sp. OttesenSCG-928-C06]|nr:type II 3-dehydroquinate dehydratase [Desulfovibrio sp. OttesenSCG-928-C06]
MHKILVMNGINLNMFGQRDPRQYGTITLAQINEKLEAEGKKLGVELEFFQSNFEGEFVEKIHAAHKNGTSGLLVNAGAWTHYSYGLMDALAILKCPVIEVHMSNVHAREDFRHFSVLSKVTVGCVAGFGEDSYLLALNALVKILNKPKA